MASLVKQVQSYISQEVFSIAPQTLKWFLVFSPSSYSVTTQEMKVGNNHHFWQKRQEWGIVYHIIEWSIWIHPTEALLIWLGHIRDYHLPEQHKHEHTRGFRWCICLQKSVQSCWTVEHDTTALLSVWCHVLAYCHSWCIFHLSTTFNKMSFRRSLWGVSNGWINGQ